jgi:PHP family Zn ribbon phosphoesterase
MLTNAKPNSHPTFRPEYLHLLSLAEIIQLTINAKKVEDAPVQALWKNFVERFGNEINALVDVQVEELKEVDSAVGENVEAFRKGFVVYEPGGGGQYGMPFICKNEKDCKEKEIEISRKLKESAKFKGQKTLGEF